MYVPERPSEEEYDPYFKSYVSLVTEPDILQALGSQLASLQMLADQVTGATELQVHPPYSWNVREVIGHLADTERVMAYRAMRLAASDVTPLPGFNQDAFVDAADHSSTTVAQLAQETYLLRYSNVFMFRRMPEEAWKRVGQVDGKPISVRAIAYVMVGHVRHHLRIVEQRVSGANSS